MRRAILAILLVPAVLSAQFGPFRRGRLIPTELPPQAPGIAREMQYRQLPISFETYSMVEHFDAPGMTNGLRPTWSTFGAGTRAEYRFTNQLSATADMTSALIGGPAYTQTGELGLRLRPLGREHRLDPYVDARVAYLYSMNNSSLSSMNNGSLSSLGFDPQLEYTQGYGTLAGAGADVRLTRRFSLMSFAAAMRARAKSYRYDGNPPRGSYPLTMYRFSIGLRYNPIRLVRQTAGDTQ